MAKNNKVAPRRISHDVMINVAFSVIRSAALFIALGVAARILSIELLGIFLLSRRVAVMAANALQLGISQCLLRFIPLNSSNKAFQAGFFYYSFVLLIFIAVIASALVAIYPSHVLEILYGNNVFEESTVYWFALLVLSTVFHYFLYSALLGSRRVFLANMFELMSAAGTMLIILLFFGPFSSIVDLLKPLSIFSAALSVGGILYCVSLWPRIEKVSKKDFFSVIKSVFVYGIPRGASSFLDISVLAILPWMIVTSPKDVSYLLMSYTILRILQVAIGPVTQILSIAIARQMGQGTLEGMRKSSHVIVTASTFLCVFILAIFWPWGPRFTQLWLGEPLLSAGVWQYLSVISLAILPYTIFYTLRNLIDVVWVVPKNLWTLLCVVSIQLVGGWVCQTLGLGLNIWVPYVFLLSTIVMGMLTIFWVREYLPSLTYMKVGVLAVGGGTLFLINYLCSDLLALIGIPVAVFFSSMIIIGALFVLKKAPVGQDILKQI